jgi:PAS domain S-box-containing protein
MGDSTTARSEPANRRVRRKVPLGAPDVEQLLTAGLRLIQETLEADQVRLLHVSRARDGLVPWLDHSACGTGEGFGDVVGAVTAAGLLPDVLAANEPLGVADLHELLPAESTCDVGGVLLVPLPTPDRVSGLLAVFTRSPHVFSSREIGFVSQVATIMAGGLDRVRIDDALRWRSQLDQLLTEVSSSFINLPASDIDAVVQDALGVVSDFVGAERGRMFLLGPDLAFETAAAWLRPGSEPCPEADPFPQSLAPAWFERLNRGETIELIPPGATNGARAEWPDSTSHGPDDRDGEPVPSGPDASVVALPMHADGHLIGWVMFDTVHRICPWPGGTAAVLRPLGHILAQAVTRGRVAAELAESENRYRTLVEDVRDVIVRLDPTGRITFVNRAWTELTGLTTEETLKRDTFESIHPDDRMIAAEHLASVSQREDMAARNVRFIAKDGSFRWMEVKGRAMRDADGNLVGLSGYLHDITDSKIAEAKIKAALEDAERARDEAERSSGAKSVFLSRMSHELRTPLNAILGFTQLLEYADLGEEEADNLRLIMQAGRHLLDLINDAMDVSRMETGKLALSPEPVRLQEVWNESLDLLRSDAAARRLTIQPLVPAEGQVRVIADRQRLRQVLVNLLSNAIKYNRPGGSVLIGCRSLDPDEVPAGTSDQHWARISVADTGLGIPAGRIDEVFVPFERLGAQLTEVEGTGVGLALAKSLVEAMGGRIGLTSTERVGSTFFVDLPMPDGTWQLEVPDAEAPSDPGCDVKDSPAATILYIEDNPSNVTLVRRVVARRPEAALLVAGDGAIGLQLLRTHRPDLVLLDLHLPRLSGTEVLAEVRADEDAQLRATPVIIVTADLTPGTEHRLMDAGATAFLSKPIDVKVLLAMIDASLHRVGADPALSVPGG